MSMERFAFKIDANLKANLYKICRLCGIDNPEKVNILGNADNIINADDGEPELWRKIQVCIGFTITKDDKMPQSICTLCVDKVNDFFEFREMCFATNMQTRKFLGIKEELTKSSVAVRSGSDATAKFPSHIAKRAVFGRRRRKRKTTGQKSLVGVCTDDLDEMAVKKSATTFVSPMRKRLRLSVFNSNESDCNTDMTCSKRQRQLTLIRRRSLGATEEENSTSKDEIKDEIASLPVKNTSVPVLSSCAAISLRANKLKQCCTICDQRFVNKAQLDRHLETVHLPNIPRYICTACNETIKKNNDIKNHQLWHKLSKTPFICGFCGDSLLSSYAYSKHLREHSCETAPAQLVLDRECPRCHHIFATTFLYNTHPCSMNTKRCAGCNRYLKNETEFLRHASFCSRIYINYSKYISDEIMAAESWVRIKNENDVEAAAAEGCILSLGATTIMNPLKTLTMPMAMSANQCVMIPSNAPSLAKASKKSMRKGISRKDLKRVDDLLKSTIDTLVSIKHEPEVQMDHELSASIMNTNINAKGGQQRAITTSSVVSPVTDYDNGDDCNHVDGFIIKTEIHENAENEHLNPNSNLNVGVNKIPVLRLKITKEHGKLNSSLVEENSRSRKKNKKKKRKDSDKEREKQVETSRTMNSDTIVMPRPGLICIKQEILDDDVAVNGEGQQSALAFLRGPVDFQISSVSSASPYFRDEGPSDLSTQNTLPAIKTEDIKPSQTELDRLLQITNICERVDMPQEDTDKRGLELVRNETSNEPEKFRTQVQLPQIVSVCGGYDTDALPVAIKKEPQDEDDDHVPLAEPITSEQDRLAHTNVTKEEPTEIEASDNDFAKVIAVKEEAKEDDNDDDIDISDVEVKPILEDLQAKCKPDDISENQDAAVANCIADDANVEERGGEDINDHREQRDMKTSSLLKETKLIDGRNVDTSGDENNSDAASNSGPTTNNVESSQINEDATKVLGDGGVPTADHNATTSECEKMKEKEVETETKVDSKAGTSSPSSTSSSDTASDCHSDVVITGTVTEVASTDLTAQPFSQEQTEEDDTATDDEDCRHEGYALEVRQNQMNQDISDRIRLTPESAALSSTPTAATVATAPATESLVVPRRTLLFPSREETENLINESNVTTSECERNVMVASTLSHNGQMSMDNNNINEIEENNNNANIERELSDDYQSIAAVSATEEDVRT